MNLQLLEEALNANHWAIHKNHKGEITPRHQITVLQAHEISGTIKYSNVISYWKSNEKREVIGEVQTLEIPENFEEAKQIARRLARKGFHGIINTIVRKKFSYLQDDYFAFLDTLNRGHWTF